MVTLTNLALSMMTCSFLVPDADCCLQYAESWRAPESTSAYMKHQAMNRTTPGASERIIPSDHFLSAVSMRKLPCLEPLSGEWMKLDLDDLLINDELSALAIADSLVSRALRFCSEAVDGRKEEAMATSFFSLLGSWLFEVEVFSSWREAEWDDMATDGFPGMHRTGRKTSSSSRKESLSTPEFEAQGYEDMVTT